MARKVKALAIGDAMIHGEAFGKAVEKNLSNFVDQVVCGEWESDYPKLQNRRLIVEQQGPEVEVVDDTILKEGGDAEILTGLFVPVSSKVMDAMPNLRVAGVSRAGLENVNVIEATKRGVVVFNVMGRNAHAVSDFAVGMMLAEARNIARAHYSIKNHEWRKKFFNSDAVPELNGKTIGLVGFGYIGHLVAKKLSGFDCNVIVYDPYAKEEDIKASGCTKVEIEELFKTADFISIHARLTEANKKMIGAELLNMMKPTAYFINTGRAGLVDQDALVDVLQKGKIKGAALDVFTTEPLQDERFIELDNVTLTTHIAGTTTDALTNSPYLLTEDIRKFLAGEQPRFIVNKEVLKDERVIKWLEGLK